MRPDHTQPHHAAVATPAAPGDVLLTGKAGRRVQQVQGATALRLKAMEGQAAITATTIMARAMATRIAQQQAVALDARVQFAEEHVSDRAAAHAAYLAEGFVLASYADIVSMGR